MRFVMGVQTASGQLVLTKDLLDELCAMLPAQEQELRNAFLTLEQKVKAATVNLGPEYV